MAIAKSETGNHALTELVRWMHETDTTQADLASFAQVSQAQISRYLAGKVDLPMERALKLSLVTNIPVEKLLNRQGASRLAKVLGKRANSSMEIPGESD
jgi:transcriptional regulator with XRE-family HTH domain